MHLPGSYAELAALVVASAIPLACAQRIGWPLGAALVAGEALAFALVGNVTLPFAAASVAICITFRRVEHPGAASFVREGAFLLGGLGLYTGVRMLIESDTAPAFANARDVIAFERTLGLYGEPDIQRAVVRSEPLTHAFNWFYSFGFLAFIAAALIWLWASDARAYRFLRNSLGLAVLPAVATIALLPVAPPRLLAESGMVDTVAVLGREHAFANEYAAVPSLHVGWMLVAGIALALTLRGPWRLLAAVAPGGLMMCTVIVTGNHYWIDGVVGAVYSLTFAALAGAGRIGVPARAVARGARALARELAVFGTPRVALSAIAMGALITYMAGMQITSPGFTDFWGYLFGQVIFVTLLLFGAEMLFRRQGGLTVTTHVIAVACCYADVLGTDGNLYANIDEYDKLTHFAGVAAITAGVYDGLRCMRMRGWTQLAAPERLFAAIVAGFAVGVAWEAYEFVGDKAFQTLRVQSKWDTVNDIFSDAAGAISIAALLWLGELPSARREEAPGSGDRLLERSGSDGA